MEKGIKGNVYCVKYLVNSMALKGYLHAKVVVPLDRTGRDPECLLTIEDCTKEDNFSNLKTWKEDNDLSKENPHIIELESTRHLKVNQGLYETDPYE